jgi:ferredoxin
MAQDGTKSPWKKAASAIVKAGILPFPPSDTFIDIMKMYLDENEAAFIAQAFRLKSSQTMEQLVKSTKGMAEADIETICEGLAKKGFIFNQPSSAGLMIYRLLPLVMIGVFEYTFMRSMSEEPEEQERLQTLAKLYQKLLGNLRDSIQGAYDNFLPVFEKQPPIDRTVPLTSTESGTEIIIGQDLGEVGEQIMLAKNVEEIINKFDDIAVGNCFCRSYQKMLGHECETHAPMEACFTFGKSARHVTNQGFAKKIDKDEALTILKQAEDAGLVHKAFHNNSDVHEIENSICNCCKDCCDTFSFWRSGTFPLVNYSMYLAKVNEDGCTGCGICESRCPVGSAKVADDAKAKIDDTMCIGCGVCAHFCPEGVISLLEKPRTVFLPPPRLN